MSSHPHPFALFLGHFHPVLVHLPIGALILLGVLELLALLPRFKDAAQNRLLILGVATLGAAAAAACGWLLSLGGGYDAQLLSWHRLAGLSLAALCAFTWLVCRSNRLRAYQFSLLATLLLLVVAGHLGSTLTHGQGFLLQYAPAPLRSLFGENGSISDPNPAAVSRREVFTSQIQPILQRRCTACHGPEKQKAGLRTDSYASLLKGSEHGPVLIAGNARDSLMIKRVLLPPNNDDHMPPAGKPQLTPEEIALLQWWINVGAPAQGDFAALKQDTNVLRTGESPPN